MGGCGGLPLTLLLLLILCPLTISADKWWESTVIYQIYPQSFYDFDGDGFGDLKGIEAKASYMNELGVGAIWLNPIYKSPRKDNGYDISDFKAIDPQYGTIEDFESMLKTYVNKYGIKVILDFVPNHSSDEHEWFQNSVKKIDPYTNFYVWADAKEWVDGKPVPPNNWMSVLGGGPAWEWNKERGQFYYHAFFKEQPDLNFRSEDLIEEMLEAMEFWLEKGVQGFRVDAVPWLIEDAKFLDEPYPGHYTQNLPGTYRLIEAFRAFLDKYGADHNKEIFLTTEAYANPDQILRYYGTPEQPGAHFPFNFNLLTDLHGGTNAHGLNNTISGFLSSLKKDQIPNWVSGNHDTVRIQSRMGFSSAVDILNILNLLLPGTATVYYGDEIGMDSFWNFDRAACSERARNDYRTPHRTPFQWTNEKNAGFTKSDKPWLPVNPEYYHVNVVAQRKIPCNLGATTHLRNFKKLVEMKKKNLAIREGTTSTYVLNDSVFAFARVYQKLMSLVLINLGATQSEPLALAKSIPIVARAALVDVEVKSVNMPSDISVAKLFPGPFIMPPKSSIVLSYRLTTLTPNIKIPQALPQSLEELKRSNSRLKCIPSA